MRCLWRLSLFALPLLLAISLKGQQSQPHSAPFPAPRDAQAVNVLNLALSTAGGINALNAIADYRVTGTIVSSNGQPSQDSVIISGRGPNELRRDLTNSGAISTSVISDVTTSDEYPNGYIAARAIQPPMMAGNFAMPYRELALVLSSSQFSLTYVGVIQLGAESVHDIQAQLAPGSLHVYQTVDFLVDISTLRISAIRDTLPRRATPRTIAYSDFRTVAGILVPFEISESIGSGQPICVTQLNQVQFNIGLPDATFQLGSNPQ